MNGKTHFDIYLHFTSAAEFQRFVEIIRGGPLDAEAMKQLQQMTADLMKSDAALQAAIDANKEK